MVRGAAPMPDRSIGTVVGGKVTVLVVPSGFLMTVLAYLLATVMLNCTLPWNALSGWASSPVAITPVV